MSDILGLFHSCTPDPSTGVSQEVGSVTGKTGLWQSGQVEVRAGVVRSMEDRFLNDGNRDSAFLRPNLSFPSLLSDRRRLGSNEYRTRDFSERERDGSLASLQLQNVGHVEEDTMECLLLGILPPDEANVDEEDTAMCAVDASAVDEGFRLVELEVGGGVCVIFVSKRRENDTSVSQTTAPSCLASSSNCSSASSSV